MEEGGVGVVGGVGMEVSTERTKSPAFAYLLGEVCGFSKSPRSIV